MKVELEKITDDTEIKSILYALEKIEQGGDKTTVLELVDAIPTTLGDESAPGPHEIIRVLVNDYRNGAIELAELKDAIFGLLDEYGLLKKAV
jgi:hypothetical protein